MSKTLETLFALVTSSRVGATLGDPRPAFVVGSDGAAVRFLNAAAARLIGVAHADEVLGKGLPLDEAIVRHVARFARNAAPGRQSVEMVRFFDGMKPVLHQCILIHLGVLAGETSVLIILANPPRLIGATDFAASLDLIAASDRLLAAFDAEGEVLAASGDYGFLDGSQDEIERFVVEAGEAAVSRRRYQSAGRPAEAVVVRIGGEAGLRILSIGRVAPPEDEPDAPESEADEAETFAGRDEAETAEPGAAKPDAASEIAPPAAAAAPGAADEAGSEPLPARFDPWSDDFAGIGDPVFWGLSPLSIQEDEARWRADEEGAVAADPHAETAEAADEPARAAGAEAAEATAESRAAAIVDALEPTAPAPPFPGARPEDLARIVEIVTQGGGASVAADDAARGAAEVAGPVGGEAAEVVASEETAEPEEAVEAPVAENSSDRAGVAGADSEPARQAEAAAEPSADAGAAEEAGTVVAPTVRETDLEPVAALVSAAGGTGRGEADAEAEADIVGPIEGAAEGAAATDRAPSEPVAIETESPVGAQPEADRPEIGRPAIAEAFMHEGTPVVEGDATAADGVETVAEPVDAGLQGGERRAADGETHADDGAVAASADAVSEASSEPAAGVAAAAWAEEPAAPEEAKTESAAGPADADFPDGDTAEEPAAEAAAGAEPDSDISPAAATTSEDAPGMLAEAAAGAGTAAPLETDIAPAADEAGAGEPILASEAPVQASDDDRAAVMAPATDETGADEPTVSSEAPIPASDGETTREIGSASDEAGGAEPAASFAAPAAASVDDRPAGIVPASGEARAEKPALSSDEPDAASDASGFVFAAVPRLRRFVWQMDAGETFTLISDELAAAVGPRAAVLTGETWSALAGRLGLDPEGRVATALSRRDTWSGLTVLWPVEGEALRVPVDLAALPAFGRGRTFEGYRGFGICRLAETVPDPAATGLRLRRDDAAVDDGSGEETAEDAPEPSTGDAATGPAVAEGGAAGEAARAVPADDESAAVAAETAGAAGLPVTEPGEPAGELPTRPTATETAAQTDTPADETGAVAEPSDGATADVEAAPETMPAAEPQRAAALETPALSDATADETVGTPAETGEAATVPPVAAPSEPAASAEDGPSTASDDDRVGAGVGDFVTPAVAAGIAGAGALFAGAMHSRMAASVEEAGADTGETPDTAPPADEGRLSPAEAAEPVEAVSEVAEPVDAVSEVAESVETASETPEPVKTASEAAEPVEVASEASEPVEATSESAEPVGAASEAAEPVEVASEASEPVEAASKAAEPVEAASEESEPVEAVSEASEPVEAASDASGPVEVTSEPVEATSEASELVEAVSEASQPVEAASEAAEAVEAVEPVEAASEAAEPVEATSETSEPVDALSEASEPVEASSEAAEPVGATSEASEPVETAPEAAEPVEAVAKAAEPVEAASEAAEPVEAASKAAGPVAAVSEGSEPVEADSEGAQPIGAAEEVAEAPSTLVDAEAAAMASPTGAAEIEDRADRAWALAAAAEEPGLASVDEPAAAEEPEIATATAEVPEVPGPAGLLSAPSSVADASQEAAVSDEPVEAVSETAEPVEAVSETAEPVEAVSETAEAAEAVSEAAEPVEAVSETAEPVEAVSEAAEPVEAVSETAEPVEAVSEAAEPVEAVSEAAEPVSEAAEPVEAASEAAEPVEAVSEAAEPVEAVSETAEPVEAVSEAAEPVEAVSEAAEPVEVASEAAEPVEAVPEAAEPVDAVSEAAEAAQPVEAVSETAEPVEDLAEAEAGAALPGVEDSVRPAFLTTSAGALPQGDDAGAPAPAGEGERAEAATVDAAPSEPDAEGTADAKAAEPAAGPDADAPAPSGPKSPVEARVVTVPTNRNSRIVTLPSAARPSEGNRLSGPERIAFRQIAAALGARIEGEEAAPGAAPAGTPDRATDRATGAEASSPDEGVAAAGAEPMPFAALDGAGAPAAESSTPDGPFAEDRETGLPDEVAAETGEAAGRDEAGGHPRDVGEAIETAVGDDEGRAARAATEAVAALQAVAAPGISEPTAEAGAVPSAFAQPAPIPSAFAPTAPIPSAFAQAAGEVATAMRLIDRLPIGAAVLKGEGIAHANQAFLDMLGFADLADLEAVGGIDALFAGEHVGRRFGEGGEGRPLPAITRDGQVIPVAARLVGIPWGAASALLLTLERRPRQQIEAVTETVSGRAALDALGEARERASELEAIVDTATDGVLMLDADGRVVSANRAAEALFGMERAEMTNRPLTDLLAPESRRSAQDYLDGLARNGVASVLNDGREVIGRVSPEGLIPLFMTIGRISSGPASKFCAVLRDITQWKKSEEELTEARRRAEEASVHKSEFLAKISHEIRTPLNAIIGFSEVMLDERFGSIGNDRYRDYLKDVHTSGTHIMSLINDLLDLSKVEAGKMELKFEAVSLADILGECVAMMQPQANRERIIIRTALPASVPPVVADPRSVRQIVLNLLSNAVKFTPAGGQVIVSIALEDSGEVVMRVRDTGLGMTEKEIQTALEPFRQLHTTRVRGGGTGLGLPLTKALVEANRAAFRIDSTVNQGTLVSITFPVTRVLAG